jgi:hypothetical protein
MTAFEKGFNVRQEVSAGAHADVPAYRHYNALKAAHVKVHVASVL